MILHCHLFTRKKLHLFSHKKYTNWKFNSTSTHVTALALSGLFLQFVEKAPEDIVRGVREKAEEAKEKIALTEKRLLLLRTTIPVPDCWPSPPSQKMDSNCHSSTVFVITVHHERMKKLIDANLCKAFRVVRAPFFWVNLCSPPSIEE